MASSTPSTPKATAFLTPRKIAVLKESASSRREAQNFTTPKIKSNSYTVTPNKKNGLKNPNSDTPECFSVVTVETPDYGIKRRSSDEVNNLTVAVRIRPMNSRELSVVGAVDVVKVRDENLIIHSNHHPLVSASGLNVQHHIFQYDHIFWSCNEANPLYSSQEDVFFTIGKPLLNSAFRGYNACLFAYGQTGSGKSFSMMGRNTCEIVDIDSEEYSGLIPRFCRDLFEQISNLPENCTATVDVSYFEIYNEKIHDLLSIQNLNNGKTALKVREHPVWGPYVVDLSTHRVTNYKELRNWLLIGNKSRATAATTMNEKSSRSHSIFSIELCLLDGNNEGTDNSRRSKVSLVDLAGSERLSNCHNNDEQMRQGVCINKSLLTLGKVISALADQRKNQFVPYRDSVLTWLLRESLGGNSLTSMLATITPASTNLDETLATLRYACQARAIVNRARVNENPHDRIIRELRTEVERLRALRQDYERNSLSCSSSLHLEVSNEELNDLRQKLSLTENKLLDAERNWQQHLMETKQTQLKELAEAEKLREELESRVRILKTADTNLNLSLYKTNFLQELEGVLTSSDTNNYSYIDNSLIDTIKLWCSENNLNCDVRPNSLTLTDVENKRQAIVQFSQINALRGYENISDFIDGLNWIKLNKAVKKLCKSEVKKLMNQIYENLSVLQPSTSDNDDNLNLLFAKVNKVLQSFETALLNSVSKSSGSKSVTFNMNNNTDHTI